MIMLVVALSVLGFAAATDEAALAAPAAPAAAGQGSAHPLATASGAKI